MKNYIRKAPIFPQKTVLSFLLFSIFSLFVIYLKFGTQSNAFIILLGIVVVLLLVASILLLSTISRYSFERYFIKMSYANLPYKYIKYNNVKCIVISNAIYNSSRHDVNIADIPMCYKRKDITGKTQRIQYPYISLVCSDKSFELKKGMNSRQLHYLGVDNVISLGICWKEAFNEITKHLDVPIYILEDVYSRFEDTFSYSNNKSKISIIGQKKLVNIRDGSLSDD